MTEAPPLKCCIFKLLCLLVFLLDYLIYIFLSDVSVLKQLADKTCVFVASLDFSQTRGRSRFLFAMMDLGSSNEEW